MLWDADEKVLSVETEIALLQARQEDLENLIREREAKLRRAVVELSVERGRLLDEPEFDPAVIVDVDKQIQHLERRIADVHEEQQLQFDQIQEELQEKQERLVLLHKAQVESEVRMIKLLKDVKPDPCPQNLNKLYESINITLGLFGSRLPA